MRFASLILLAVAVSGCAKPPAAPPPRAEAIRVETKAAAIDIGQAVNDGKAWIAKAHVALRAEIARIELTEPAPALRDVSGDLTRAEAALEPVGPATRAIAGLADQAKVETDRESKKKEDVQDKLDKERASFWSYKQRVLFYGIAAFVGVVLVVLMLLRAFGGSVVVEVVSDILRACWAGIKAVALFPLWLIDRLNDKYDAKEKQGEKK